MNDIVTYSQQFQTVLKICNATAIDLMNLYSKQHNKNNKYNGKLIFPFVRSGNGKLRVSEQEARFLFVKQLENQSEYNYSVETPTKKRYSKFSSSKPQVHEDDKGRSASIDLSLYKKDFNNPLVNIEFKSGPSKQNTITKDFLKLCTENHLLGIYFHVFESCNRKTILKLVTRINEALKYMEFVKKDKSSIDLKNPILIFIVILNYKDSGKTIKFNVSRLSDRIIFNENANLI